MNAKRLLTMSALASAIIVPTLAQAAGPTRILGRFSGTAVSTAIDTNGDGITASSSEVNIRTKSSLLGRLTLRGVGETKPSLADPTDPRSFVQCQLPNGDPGIQFELVQESGAAEVEKSGDLFYVDTLSGLDCASVATCFDEVGRNLKGCIFSLSRSATIIGGTGRLAGASGFFEARGTGKVTFAGPTGSMNAFTGRITGEINIPSR